MCLQLYRNARIFSPVDGGKPASGISQGTLKHYLRGALLVRDGIIAAIGNEGDILQNLKRKMSALKLTAMGNV